MDAKGGKMGGGIDWGWNSHTIHTYFKQITEIKNLLRSGNSAQLSVIT